MKTSAHTHPRYIVWLKYFIFASAIIFFLDFLYTEFVMYSRSGSIVSAVLGMLFAILFCSIPFLITAYFFGQNITVTNDGLLIEFLWKDLFVPWEKIIEIKPAFGFLGNSQNTKNLHCTDRCSYTISSFLRGDIWFVCKTCFHNLLDNQ